MTPADVAQLQEWIETACRWEASAPKPGNVHPGAAFEDLSYTDFVEAASAAAPWLSRSAASGVGAAVLNAVQATRSASRSNVNLGICLLIAPLAAVPTGVALSDGIVEVLGSLSQEDTRLIYEAIRISSPGGLGTAAEQDVSQPPTCGIVEAMQLAEDRDRIAWNYVHGFEDVLERGPKLAREWVQRGIHQRETLLVGMQLELLAEIPDSLIARKCGLEVARQASEQAQRVLQSGWPQTQESARKLEEFDRWLRGAGNRRNPGTTADLLAATLFAILRDHPQLANLLSRE